MSSLETTVLALFVAGAAFDAVGCIGMMRLPDVYSRLQVAAKCVGFGTALMLLGAAVHFLGGGEWAGGVEALLCAAFVMISAPTAAHALARSARASGHELWEGSVVDAYAEDAAEEELL